MLSLLAALIPSFLFTASSQIMNAPRIPVKEGTSTNWSGYAVETNLTTPQKGAVTDVKGTWIVPAVSGSTSETSYSSIWIGIDGYASNTVEQIGTDQDVINGVPTYYAWFEMYPKYPFNLNTTLYPVQPGDTITAEVKYDGKNFILTISNANSSMHGRSKIKGWTFSTTQKSASANRSSAEWIAEAPWSSKVLPLANFGTATFTSASATLNNITGSISNSAWQNDAIKMINSSGAPKATPSGLSPDGSSFSVTWNSN